MTQVFFKSLLFLSLLTMAPMGSQSSQAADTERGIRVEADRPITLSGLEGQVQTGDSQGLVQSTALHFGDTLQIGDRVHTGQQSRAELLVGHGELVTLGEQTTVKIRPGTSAGNVVEMEEGTIRVAVAESQLSAEETVSVQVQSTRAHTRSGIFHVTLKTNPVLSQSLEGPLPSGIQLVSYPPKETLAKADNAVVVYTVEEGTLTLEGTGQPLVVKAGQSVEVTNGQTGAPFASASRGVDPTIITPLTAATQHRQTPKTGLEYLASQEMKQAEVLGHVLSGVAAKESQAIDDQAKSEEDVILATTGVTLAGGVSTPPDPPSLPPLGGLFGGAPEVGGPTGSLLDPVSNSTFNLVFGPVIDIPQPKGGGGLLLFNDSKVTLNGSINNGNQQIEIDFTPFNTELMLIDSGDLELAPHMGQVPTERLTVTNLVFGLGGTPPDPTETDPGRNLYLPFQFSSTIPGETDDPANIPRANVLTQYSEPADENAMLSVLETFAASPEVAPSTPPVFGDIFPAVNTSNDVGNGVHGMIRARQDSDADSIELAGGVVLNNNTHVVATSTRATAEYFQQPNDIDGSIAAVVGRNYDLLIENMVADPEGPILDSIQIQGGQLNPVNLKMEDRILGVLDGSTIKPDTSDPANTPNIALLALLDSRLEGPTEPPNLIPGDTQPVAEEGQPPIPVGKSRADIPGLIEIMETGTPDLDQADQAFQWAVEAHSAIVVRGELAPSILEASGPLVSMFQSTMMTTGDVVRIEKTGEAGAAQLMASLQQAGVLQGAVQLNNSQLKVGGHLFNFLNGATGDVTGNLVALANNSTLTVEGVLLAVGLDSSFTLSGGSLVAFGFGTNTVNISGAGECAGCTLTTDIENLQGVPVLAHPTATINVGEGFVPYAGVGQGDMPMDFNNTVNVTDGAAVLHVGENANLTLNP